MYLPSPSGLWAQHHSTLISHKIQCNKKVVLAKNCLNIKWWLCMFCVIWPGPSVAHVRQIQILATLPAFHCLMASIAMLSKLTTSFRRKVYEMAHNEAIKSRHLFKHKRLAADIRDAVCYAWKGRHWDHFGVYRPTWYSSDNLADSHTRKYLNNVFHCIRLSSIIFSIILPNAPVSIFPLILIFTPKP